MEDLLIGSLLISWYDWGIFVVGVVVVDDEGVDNGNDLVVWFNTILEDWICFNVFNDDDDDGDENNWNEWFLISIIAIHE